MPDSTTPTAKPWWHSKTVWLNAVTLIAVAVPAVREWVEKNPVPVLQALGAAGVILRFVTSGKIAIFGDDDEDSPTGTGVSGGGQGKIAGSDAGAQNGLHRRSGVPWLVGPACGVLLLTGCTVGVDSTGGWSIKPDPHSVDAALRYAIRHEGDSAKSGLTAWEYFDPETGEKIPVEDYAAWGIKAGSAE